jgi:NAD-dependent dihydropyrimidine dehydrogenase PreA subunit
MLSLDRDKCVGCGDCVTVCPQQCYTMGDDGKSIHAFPERCMECGACRLNCRSQAISVEAGAGCFVLMTKELLFGKDAVKESGSCC